MACSVLQEMANSVYLVMEVSYNGARASLGPSRIGTGGCKHTLLTFLAGILEILALDRSKKLVWGIKSLSQAGDSLAMFSWCTLVFCSIVMVETWLTTCTVSSHTPLGSVSSLKWCS